MISLAGFKHCRPIYESANSLVCRALRESDKQAAILKLLKADYPTPKELIRYQQEYAIIRSLTSQDALKVYGLEPYKNTFILILEDFGGESLKKLDLAPFDCVEFLKLAIEICEILGEIHSQNIIHKDINPSNIVLNPQTGILKIIDFGIASQLTRENPTLKNPNVLEGTLAYISPEQTGRMNRPLDYRSDFYSLGATFYELLTGKLPFESSDPMELVHCHLAKQPPPLENWEIPKAIGDIVSKLMAKNSEDRYQSAWGLKVDLKHCLTQLENTENIAYFPLGKKDISERFQIPQKLYGRESEIKTLLDAFERVAWAGKVEGMLVAGYSGIGKSALVRELYKPITEKRGYFISGKFDQFQRNIPYSAVVAAFTGLIQQLLGEPQEQLQQWREKILQAVGVNGQVIIEVIPEVELIVGQQPPVAELGPTEAQNRFNLVLGNFIRVFCSVEHPLAIFLDDLQWADSATLKLIELMMGDDQSEYLFLIGAYRDNEVDRTHPLMMMIEGLRKQEAAISQIALKPLALNHIAQLIADTLNRKPRQVKELAKLIEEKTGGNPFFVNEFFQNLYSENLLKFDVVSHSWQWDIAAIEEKGFTDNVVELMVGKLQKLPPSTQQVLSLAACLGAQFDLQTLALVCERSASEVFEDLKTAIQMGLIIPLSELDVNLLIQDYKFGHDRIQQAAYSLIPKEQKPSTHLRIGQLFLEQTPVSEREEKIFDIVGNLNRGAEEITEQTQRYELAELNLLAGEKAKKSTAYTAAIEYLKMGIELLKDDCWQTHYNLTSNLYIEASEVSYLQSDFTEMERLGNQVLEKDCQLSDKMRVYETHLQAYSVQNKFLEGIKLGLFCLNLLGIDLPQNPNDSDVLTWLNRTKKALEPFSLEELIDLQEMTDPEILSAMKILSRMISLSYFGCPNLFPLIACQGILLSLEYGNGIDSPIAYVNYGFFLCNPGFDEFAVAHQYGTFAKTLLERQHNKQRRAFVLNNLYAHVALWKEHTRNGLSHLKEGYESGLEVGDLEFAAYALTNRLLIAYSVGQELHQLKEEYKPAIEFTRSIEFEGTMQYTSCVLQTILNLIESEEPWELRGNVYDEDLVVRIFQTNNNFLGLSIHHFCKLHLNYWFDFIPQALHHLHEGEKYLSYVGGFYLLQQFALFASLINLAAMEITTGSQQEKHFEQANFWSDRLKLWAKNAPMNFQHKLDLVEAEKARILKQNWQAAELYDRAIAGAKENGYLQEEALANELAGKFYLDKGKEKIARVYLQDARYCYQHWGATTKVKQLDKKYPHLRPAVSTVDPTLTKMTTASEIATTSSTISSIGDRLDIATILKASQALSSEIKLDKLLVKLMQLIFTNAGAQKGCLLLAQDEQLLVQANGTSDQNNIQVLRAIPVQNYLEIPHRLINTVYRTQKTIVLDNASQEGDFTSDPYIQQQQCHSVLCAPLIHQGQLAGLIYLENNLSTSAFTPQRLEILRLLCAQAAISLDNARLYHNLEKAKEQLEDYSRTLEQKVAARTQEIAQKNEQLNAKNQYLSQTLEQLQRTQAQLIHTEKMSSLGQMVAGIAHEINNPVSFIYSNVDHAKQYVGDLLKLINIYQHEYPNPTAKVEETVEQIDLEFLLEDLEKLLSSMHYGAQRIQKIVLSLRNFSRLDESSMKSVDIHEGIESTLLILQNRLGGIEVIKDYGKLPRIACYASELNQVFMHIINNGIDALKMTDKEGAPQIKISTKMGDARTLKIEIADNGTGMSEAVRSHIFDPFFTTKSVGSGTGLGLSVSYEIVVEKHRGSLTCSSSPGMGTTFVIEIPLC